MVETRVFSKVSFNRTIEVTKICIPYVLIAGHLPPTETQSYVCLYIYLRWVQSSITLWTYNTSLIQGPSHHGRRDIRSLHSPMSKNLVIPFLKSKSATTQCTREHSLSIATKSLCSSEITQNIASASKHSHELHKTSQYLRVITIIIKYFSYLSAPFLKFFEFFELDHLPSS